MLFSTYTYLAFILKPLGKGYSLRIRVSKIDPFWSGTSVRLCPSGNIYLCPVEALKVLNHCSPGSGDPLLKFSSGATPMRQRLNVLIKILASRCGIQPEWYSSHSFLIAWRSLYCCSSRHPRVGNPGPRPLVKRLLPEVYPASHCRH